MEKNRHKFDGLHWFVVAVILSFSLIRMYPAVIESITVDRSLVYDGEIIDLAPVKEDVQGECMLHISKVDSQTRLPVANGYTTERKDSSDGYTTVSFPRMEEDGILYQLRFEDHRLTGYLVVDDNYLANAIQGEYNTEIKTMHNLMLAYATQAETRLAAEKC